jgi:hypothetical protein
MRVAALYVLASSSYYAAIEGVDLWPIRRDARLYSGPWPVVAHPPCGHWSPRVLHRTHDVPEHDASLGPMALGQVRRYGGVMEHPAGSKLWAFMRLPKPWPYKPRSSPSEALRDDYGGFSIEVRQAWWGDKRGKLTWLYFCHVDPAVIVLPKMIDPPPPPTDIPKRQRRDGEGFYARSWSDKMGATERKRTVPEMARWLVEIAATAERETAPG